MLEMERCGTGGRAVFAAYLALTNAADKDDFMVVLDSELIVDQHLMRRFDETHPGASMFEIMTAAVSNGRKPLLLP